MTTLKVGAIEHPTAGSLVTVNGTAPSNRNRIINGDMRIDQRNAGASVSSAGPIYTVDRWSWYYTSGSGHTIQQNADAPTGFSNSLKVTVGTGASPSASHQNIIQQPIEGYNAADLGFGAAGASTITFSFWVKSSLTGTFNVWLQNSANNRAYVSTYTISVANTWEQKSITIAGDTTGTWLKTNGTGLSVGWSLGCGSNFDTTANTWTSGDRKSTTGTTSVVATNGATFYITGVQLEAGSVATPFERIDYSESLRRCQRYFYAFPAVYHYVFKNGFYESGQLYFPVTMRASPTLSNTGNWRLRELNAASNTSYTGFNYNSNPGGFYLASTTTNNGTFYSWILDGVLSATAEL